MRAIEDDVDVITDIEGLHALEGRFYILNARQDLDVDKKRKYFQDAMQEYDDALEIHQRS